MTLIAADLRHRKVLRFFFCAALLISAAPVFGQQEEVLKRMKTLHELMISRSFIIDNYIDDNLSYGHSNGWVENRKEFKENLGTKLIYNSFAEDSIVVNVSKNVAHTRFNADIDVTLNGNRAVYKLKVIEVWVRHRKKGEWELFARQAVKR